MNLDYSAEELAFQKQVRDFLASELPKALSEKVKTGGILQKADYVQWHRILYRQGWVADNWPKQHGGTGWSATQRHIFARECALAGAPRLAPFGLKMVAPVIYSFGNDAQKSRFLPSILDASCWWCQGYSEPGAGSDLAALRTRAERDGDSYIVNGSKTWTTYAQWADWIFCLVKTGEPGLKPQRSISFLLIDMKTPGISVRPIKLLDGGHEVNEVFFDNVRVPLDNRIGEEGKGWTYAKLLLTHERTGIAQVAFSRERLQRFKALFKTEQARGITTATQALLTRTAQVEIELDALEMTELRCLAAVSTGAAPGPESSILKIKGSEIMQSIDELFLDLAGHYGLAHRRDFFVEGEGEAIGPWYAAATGNHYFNNRKVSIYGGSNEIQKNIIAKQVLGI